MCVNNSDEYLGVCDCPEETVNAVAASVQIRPRPPDQASFYDYITLSSDPWSGLHYEAH